MPLSFRGEAWSEPPGLPCRLPRRILDEIMWQEPKQVGTDADFAGPEARSTTALSGLEKTTWHWARRPSPRYLSI
jgi:hypothetical protein